MILIVHRGWMRKFIYGLLPSACRCNIEEWKTLVYISLYVRACMHDCMWTNLRACVSEKVSKRVCVWRTEGSLETPQSYLEVGLQYCVKGEFSLSLWWKFHYRWPQWISCNDFTATQTFCSSTIKTPTWKGREMTFLFLLFISFNVFNLRDLCEYLLTDMTDMLI